MKLFKAKLFFYTIVSVLAILAGFISYVEVNDISLVSAIDNLSDRIIGAEGENKIAEAIISRNNPDIRPSEDENQESSFSGRQEAQGSVRNNPEQEDPTPEPSPTPSPSPLPTATPRPTPTPTYTPCLHQWAYSENGDGTHSVVCIICGAEPYPNIEPCELNEDYMCVKCSFQHVHELELLKDGTHTYQCSCGYTEQGEHNFEVRYSDANGHILICDCGEIRSEHHNYVTNFEKKVCKDCGYVYQRYTIEELTQTMYVHCYVNQREFPTTSSKKLGNYHAGDVLNVVGYVTSYDGNADEKWYLTDKGDYVFAEYVKNVAPTATPTPTPTNTPTNTPTPKPTKKPTPTPNPGKPTPTPDLRGGLGDLSIDKILGHSDYQYQSTVYYQSNGKTKTNGLCDLCAATNLLNRKLARDGNYSKSHRFEITDVIAVVNNISRSSITYLGKDGDKPKYSYNFKPYFRENITFTTKDGGTSYTMKSVYLYSNSANYNLNYVKDLMAKHPEGVMIRGTYYSSTTNGFDHALVLTYCDANGQWYAIDTGSDQIRVNGRYENIRFGTATMKLEDTWLCGGAKKKNSKYNFWNCIWAVTYIDK